MKLSKPDKPASFFSQPSSRWRAYHRVTRTATYGFIMALPLLVLYEVAAWMLYGGRPVQIRVGAEVWMKQLLALMGVSGRFVLVGVVLVIGIGILIYERKKAIPVRFPYFGWMIGESAVYAVVLGLSISSFVGALFAVAPVTADALIAGPPEQGPATMLVLSIGAGLYEELLFRVILVGGLYLLLRRLLPGLRYAYVLSAVVGALIFSAVHYIGPLGDVFTPSSFTFRFLFGLALNVVFLARGFGVAAWTHALYDVMVVLTLEA